MTGEKVPREGIDQDQATQSGGLLAGECMMEAMNQLPREVTGLQLTGGRGSIHWVLKELPRW